MQKMWVCRACFNLNENDLLKCIDCDEKKSDPSKLRTDSDALFPMQQMLERRLDMQVAKCGESAGNIHCPTSTTLKVRWKTLKSENVHLYEVKYRPLNDKHYKSKDTKTEGVEITGLEENTKYEVKVFWIGDDGHNHIMFTDFAQTPKSKIITQKADHTEGWKAKSTKSKTKYVIKPTATTIFVRWEKVKNALKYLVKFRASGEMLFSSKDAETLEVTIDNLKEDTDYEVKLFSVDDAGLIHHMIGDVTKTLAAKSAVEYMITPSSKTLTVSWETHDADKPDKFENYQLKYRVCQVEKTGLTCIESKECKIEIPNLKPATRYEIRVFWHFHNGTNSLMFEDEAETSESVFTELTEGRLYSHDKTKTPHVYHLKPVKIREFQAENGSSINLRICDMVSIYKQQWDSNEEKTIMLLGATGTGKSTLIEAFINYITEVSYNDNHRFSLINKTNEEQDRSHNKADSQTSSITVYRIPKLKGLRVKHKVNIIDTPGFNDTRKDFDKQITKQMSDLFNNYLEHLDAVFIVLPLSVNRLTDGQQHVFKSICKLFGKDIDQNVFILITHDDGGLVNDCMNVIKNANIRHNNTNPYFRFNNANLYSPLPNDVESLKSEEKKWELRTKSFSKIFDVLSTIPRTAVETSREVMQNRTILELQLRGLEQDIKSLMGEIFRIYVTRTKIKNFEKAANANQDHLMDEEIIRREQHFTGTNSINCAKHKRTCHEGCWVYLDTLIGKCEVFKKGSCVVCNCSPSEHRRGSYTYKEVRETRKVLNKLEFENHQIARQNLFEQKTKLLELKTKFERSMLQLESMLVQMRNTLSSLNECALLPITSCEMRMQFEHVFSRIETPKKELLERCIDFFERNVSLTQMDQELLSKDIVL